MSLSESTRTEIRNCLSILKVIAGVVLLAAISWEIIAGDHMHFSRNYLIIQLVVCVLLPSLGMMFFPIFTTYVLQEYSHKKESDQ